MGPIKPDYTAALATAVRTSEARPVIYLARAATCYARSYLDGDPPGQIAKSLYTDDQVTPLITRAAQTQAMISVPSWAGELGRQSVSDLVAAASTVSAAGELISRGLQVNLDGLAQLQIPGRVVSAPAAGAWVQEGQPTPVHQQTFTAGVTLVPRRLAMIVAYTREVAESSNFENIIGAQLTENAGLALDAALFSTTAPSVSHPGGILVGITSLTPTTGGGSNALAGDLHNLGEALSTAGAGRNTVLITDLGSRLFLETYVGPRFSIPVLTSTAIAPRTLIAVEASSFASGLSSVPEFAVSAAGILHMDTAPTDISTPGAAPVQSMWQTDSFSLKMVVRASWGMRAANHVAWVTGCTW